MKPFITAALQVFDADHSGELDFGEFVKGLAMFTMKNVDRSVVAQLWFRLWLMFPVEITLCRYFLSFKLWDKTS